VVAVSHSGEFCQQLVPGEKLLFLAQNAKLTKLLPLYGSAHAGFTDIKGTLAITNQRFIITEKKGLFSANRTFEATFSPQYAAQTIKETLAKNAELTKQAAAVSGFSRTKWLVQHGFRVSVDISVAANMQKTIVGYGRVRGGVSEVLYGKEEILSIELYHAYVDKEIRQNIQAALNFKQNIEETAPNANEALKEVASITSNIAAAFFMYSTHELHLPSPLKMATSEPIDLSAEEDQWLNQIIRNFSSNPSNPYQPLLEIINQKAEEMSTFKGNYE
jgi:hypothetical protein